MSHTYSIVHVDLDVRTASGRRWNVQTLCVRDGSIKSAGAFPVRKDGSLGRWRGLNPENFQDGGASCRAAIHRQMAADLPRAHVGDT